MSGIVVPRASEDVVSMLGRPKFSALCSPSFVERDDVPCSVVELCEKLIYGVVFAEAACILVDNN